MSNTSTLESIFFEALAKESPAERRAFLDEACATDTELRRSVERLLAAQAQVGSFLESPISPPWHSGERRSDSPPHFGEGLPQDSPPRYSGEGLGEGTIDSPHIAERPGTVIGPYKLLQQIGEGGMGVVFMAEQTEPIQRTVALKIIKPGMDTRQVIARFEAERQALALMDHPNIARVLDAGTTGAGGWGLGAGEFVGQAVPDINFADRQAQPDLPPALPPAPSPQSPATRPFFVMDLVKGVPITDYCDQQHLSVRQRLELFMQVCHAVQHAHQKGIIHRDLKPSNVLVAEYDGKPVPKVIDFGVAKATAQKLTERTMFTQYGQIVGTFEYMSPEQARFNQLDVDARSDIYSLGVLLYELLTGSTPFERARIETTPFDETLRIIREEEPPKPSMRLSNSDSLPLAGRVREGVSAAATIAANRGVEPHHLMKLLRGELDWIVMKALEKDRNRRYETTAALADDIERLLRNEPVTAGPPSNFYRTRKFVHRNKWPVIAAAALLGALVAGIVGTTISLISLSQRHEIAERERIQAELNLAGELHSQSKFDEAARLYRKSLQTSTHLRAEDRRRNARTLLDLGLAVRDGGEADRLYHESLAAHREAFPPGDPSIANALVTVGLQMRESKRLAEAETMFREAHEIHRAAVPLDHFATAVSGAYLANVLSSLGENDEAESILRDSLANYELAVPRDEFLIGSARADLAKVLIKLGKFREAEAQLQGAMQYSAPSHDYFCVVAMVALYTAWDLAEPGKGYDAKAREWTLKIVENYFKPQQKRTRNPSPAESKKGEEASVPEPSPETP